MDEALQGPWKTVGCNIKVLPLGTRSVGLPSVASQASFHAFTKHLPGVKDFLGETFNLHEWIGVGQSFGSLTSVLMVHSGGGEGMDFKFSDFSHTSKSYFPNTT